VFVFVSHDASLGESIIIKIKPLLIAEIGNNHFGDMDKAKEMIFLARDSGADLVKFQAIDESCTGSMENSFYKQCALTTEQYIELIQFGEWFGIEVFYSVISHKHIKLYDYQKHHKITGSMSKLIGANLYHGQLSTSEIFKKVVGKEAFEIVGDIFISLPIGHVSISNVYKDFTPLYVSEYLTTNPRIENLSFFMTNFAGVKSYGYSDHSINLVAIESAIKQYNCNVIEKHFAPFGEQKFNGVTFRDTIHGTNEAGLTKIASRLRG